MAGLSILKHTHNLSDEELCVRGVENSHFQLFCGEEFFRHRPPFDRSSLARWCQRTGKEKLVALIPESLSGRRGPVPPNPRTSPRSSLGQATAVRYGECLPGRTALVLLVS